MSPREIHVHLYLDVPPGTSLVVHVEPAAERAGAECAGLTAAPGSPELAEAELTGDERASEAVARVVATRTATPATEQAVTGLRELGYRFIPSAGRDGYDRPRKAYVRFVRAGEAPVIGYLHPTFIKFTRPADVARVKDLTGARPTGRTVAFSLAEGLAAAALLAGRDDWDTAGAALAAPPRPCKQCGGPIPDTERRDAAFCRPEHRAAWHQVLRNEGGSRAAG
jgi:hypothetical protein